MRTSGYQEVYVFARKAVRYRKNLAKVGAMKPKDSPCEDPQGDLFKVELETIIDMDHAMVKLAQGVNWSRLEETFGAYYCDDNGAPRRSSRLMVAPHYLEYMWAGGDGVNWLCVCGAG
jgi:hypothetical protein